MPRVPQLDRSVSPAPMPGVRDQAVSNEGLQRAAAGFNRSVTGVAADIRQEEIDKVDEQALFEARRRLNKWEIERVYDPQKGAMATKGRQAFDLPKSLDEEFKTFSAEVEKGLTTERQRMAFRQMSEGRRVQINEWANKHEYGERERFYLEQYGADIENSKERAAASMDPKTAETEIAVQSQRTVDYLTSQGKSPEFIKQQLQKDETDTHARVIDSMMSKGEDLAAEGYYAKVKDRMDPDARKVYNERVAENSRLGKSQRIADSIQSRFASVYSDVHGEDEILTEDGAIEAAKKEAGDDPKVREMSIDRVRQAWALRERDQKDYLDKSYTTASTMVEAGSSLDDVRGMLDESWFHMRPEQRASIEAQIKHKNMGTQPDMDANGGKGWQVYLSFPTDPKEIAKMSQADVIHKYRGHLDDAHFNRVVETWRGVKEAEAAGRSAFKDPKVAETLSFNQEVENAARLGGLIPEDGSPSKLKGNDAKRYAQWERSAAVAIQEAETFKGGKLTSEERQKTLDTLLLNKVFVERWGTDPQVPVAVLTDEDRGVAYVPKKDIPAPAITEMEGVIRSMGKRVTEDKLQRMRAARLMDNRELYLKIAGE